DRISFQFSTSVRHGFLLCFPQVYIRQRSQDSPPVSFPEMNSGTCHEYFTRLASSLLQGQQPPLATCLLQGQQPPLASCLLQGQQSPLASRLLPCQHPPLARHLLQSQHPIGHDRK
ncbi:MAG: hypothetical protein KC518_14595, partial [Candidatus Cloacimonetes bacterium]|nr:hypothetical protein [Candidatus Cloacimonadota bacterium]